MIPKAILQLVFKRMDRVADGVADTKIVGDTICFKYYGLDEQDNEVIQTYQISITDITKVIRK